MGPKEGAWEDFFMLPALSRASSISAMELVFCYPGLIVFVKAPDNFDFRRYDFAQMNVALWKMKNPKMSDKKRAKIAQTCMDGRRPCVYGVIRLCGVGAGWASSLEN